MPRRAGDSVKSAKIEDSPGGVRKRAANPVLREPDKGNLGVALGVAPAEKVETSATAILHAPQAIPSTEITPSRNESVVSPIGRLAHSHRNEQRLTIEEFRAYVDEWNIEGQLRQHTAQGVRSRVMRMEKFFWFVEHNNIQTIGTPELRAFFLYCAEGHLQPGGRWGNPKQTSPMRPISLLGYHRILKAFYNYLVSEGIVEVNPVKKIKPPSARAEIKNPVADEHLEKLIRACKQSEYARRDTAILLLLVDTGIRATELCNLTIGDWEAEGHSLCVLGKGNKYRTVFVGLAATKALTSYLRGKNHSAETPLFISRKGKAFTASGVYLLMGRLARAAKVPNPGVHALRRTFAVNMLRAGANVFTVQTLLGHSDLTMTRRYCKVAEADCEEQHRKFSPADRLKLR